MPKKRRYHHPDLRQTLLEGAVRLIKRDGMRNFSLRKLAAEAGVSHTAPYRHFDSKEEILAILMLEGHRMLRAGLVAARDACDGDCGAKMIALTQAYLHFASAHPEYLKVMFSCGGITSVMKVRKKMEFPEQDYDAFGVLEAQIKECQTTGSLEAKADSKALSLLAWAEVHGLALLRNEGIIASLSERYGQTEAMTLDSIFKISHARFSR
jgi:AcrR family transcriptional regulator